MEKGLVSVWRKRKKILVVGVILAITVVHLIISFIIMNVVDDNWGERATVYAEQHLEEHYEGHYEGYRVEGGSGGFSMFGGLPLGWWEGLGPPFMVFTLPYQALFMELYYRGLTSRWLFPLWVGIQYTVYDQDGQLVKRGYTEFYVISRNRAYWLGPERWISVLGPERFPRVD